MKFREGELDKLKRILPGIGKLARHPVFEIAEQAPVFLVDDKVYSLGEGTALVEDNVYEQKGTIRSTRTPLIEVGDFDSLEALALDRAQLDIERTGEAYAKEAQRDLNVLKGLDGDLDTPQLIYKLVFPYLQDGHYKERVSELLGVEEKREAPRSPQKKGKVSQRLEQIADEIETEVKGLIRQIEQEEQEPAVRTKKHSKLDALFDYEKPQHHDGNSLLGRALDGRNIAIVEGEAYDLIVGSDGCKKHVQVDGRRFSLVEREEPKREPKTEFEVGDEVLGKGSYEGKKLEKLKGKVVRVNAGKIGVEWEKDIEGHDCYGSAKGGYGWFVRKENLEDLSEIVIGNGATAGDLEGRFLIELGKKVRVDALREHLSRDKIIDLLRTKDAELLAMAGRKEYEGEGFGFTQDGNGHYYAYIDFPTMAIKSEIDKNYYLYDKTKIGVGVCKDRSNLRCDLDFYMVENNGHPYVHVNNKRFAEICQGDATDKMPTSGRDTGEIIAKRLRKMKEVLMFGYTWQFFDPVYEGEQWNKDPNKYRRKLSELQRMNIPIIVKGELIK